MPSEAVMDGIKHAYWKSIKADTIGARFAGQVSFGFPCVIFVHQEIPKGANGDSSFSLPMVLPYTTSHFLSIGNASSSYGYRTIMRVFNASMGYAKLRIQHLFSRRKGEKEYVFATTELCVLDMTIDKSIEGYAIEIQGNRWGPPITNAYSALGLNFTKNDLEGIDMSVVPAYETTIIMKDTRHATAHHVINEMARDRVGGFREIVDVVNSVFSQRHKPLKMTFFVPGYDDQCLRALAKLNEARRRCATSPYLPLCAKVPTTNKFSHPSQMVSLQDLSKNLKQESTEVYYQDVLEMVARLSYACRSEQLKAESDGEWLMNRPQKGIRIPLPFLQIKGQVAAGLIILPAPQGMEAMPAIGEVVQLKVDVKFTMQTPPDAKLIQQEMCNKLASQIWDIIQKARALGDHRLYATVGHIRAGLELIAIPAKTKAEGDQRQKWLDNFAKQCMPQLVNSVREPPYQHKPRVESLVEGNYKYFQLREPTTDEAPMLTAVRVATPPFLQAYGPHCYYTVDPKQPNWPKNGTVAPRVQCDWPNVPLETTIDAQNKAVQYAIKNKTFNLWIHRICHDETLLTQLRGIHDFAPSPVDNTEFARFGRWCLDFAETTEKHDPAEFWPALKHLRDRVQGKKFEDSVHADLRQSKPEPGHLEIEDEGPPQISRELSDRLLKAFDVLDKDQKKVILATDLSHGVLLVNGCPGSGKSFVALFMAILSILTTVDVSRFPANISSPTPQVGQVGFKKGMAAISADTHDQLATTAEKIDKMGTSMFNSEFLIVYVTNPSMTSSTLGDLLGDKRDMFEDIQRPELDSSTVEYMLFEAGNEFKKDTNRPIPGLKYNIASHIRDLVNAARLGLPSAPVAQRVSDLMVTRKRNPTAFANDKDMVMELKQCISDLEMLIYNMADFIVGTPVALGRLARNRGFTGIINCLMIDEAYRMTEANMMSLFATFKDAPIRELVGDIRQMSPVVTTLCTDTNAKSELAFTNPFAEQMSQSMPARMEATGFTPYSLNVNHRGINGSSRFCSDHFYDGAMIEARDEDESHAEIQHAIGILSKRFNRELRGTMFNFDLYESYEFNSGNSYENGRHAWFIADLCTQLHSNGAAKKHPTTDEEGERAKILIQCMYKEQVQVVRTQLQRLPKGAVCMELITVATVDGSQGDEAEIVIVDMVRTLAVGFTGDHRRVNVAYSRARFFTITVANYESVSTRRNRVHPAAEILVKQHKWAKARNSEVQLSNSQMLSCARCLGQSHQGGNYEANLECSACFEIGHHARNCGKVGVLTPTIPKLHPGETTGSDTASKPKPSATT
ncbi:hypothetical protein PG996_007715 [Apiospora saccharicola]|uniref:DNA2/NAM7 helicase-like C-terminal domain-containing protein n=1 Tax=Apiospora saccharicola TaxID=335842 RepID=A0ABR1VBQ2_9PEZI